MSAPHPPPDTAARHTVPAELIHDLRTPLGQIIGYSEMLVEQAHQGGHGGLVPDLQKVGAAGWRLLALIADNFHSVPTPDAGTRAPPANGRGHEGPPPPAGQAPPRTRLSAFITANREPILAEWEAFARTCTPASGAMDYEALRDHAGEMLTVIAADLDTPQGGAEQSEKSRGNAPDVDGGRATAAEEHGAGRAESGFTIEQMVSEYRALRASVIRLWTGSQGGLGLGDLEDLTRFNEAVDQSLAESVTRYTQQLDESKEMFLAMLGHDLRSPLGAVLTSAQFMLETGELEEPHRTLTERIAGSSGRMVHMVGALLDFTRSRLGGGIPVERAGMNMGKAVHDVVDEIAAAHPSRTIQVDAQGELQGEWDCARISQVMSNLVVNAVEHGSDGTLINVEARGNGEEVTIAVHNQGPMIPSGQRDGIFNPMKARDGAQHAAAGGPSGNLGLGLYIAERIVSAHSGRIEVESSDAGGTTFTVHLPRRG